MSVTYDRPSPTILMTANNDLSAIIKESPTFVMTANNDFCDIMQESLFGKQELLYNNRPLSAGYQLLFYVVEGKPAQDMPLVYRASRSGE